MNETIPADNAPGARRKAVFLLLLVASGFAITFVLAKLANQNPTPPKGMVLIPAGASLMGSPN